MKKVFLTLFAAALLSSVQIVSAQNIAVVDVPVVVAKSAQVQSLKKEQKNKIKDLDKWLKTAKADVEKQQTKEDREKMLKKYNAELAKKRAAIAKEYATKLTAIDKNITETISAKAKEMGYDMVVSKAMVISGGDDITAEIQKAVK